MKGNRDEVTTIPQPNTRNQGDHRLPGHRQNGPVMKREEPKRKEQKMAQSRDSQRIKVYRAGWEFADLLPDHYMPNIRSVQTWVNGIVGSNWWREQYPDIRHVEVKDGRGRRKAGGWSSRGWGTITLPRALRHQKTILHELAHVVTSYDVASHGKIFVQNWLALVDKWMGDLEGAALRWFLAKHRVKWDEPMEEQNVTA